ncbi:MAG TPA: alpha/beta hydrolase-fold protein [Terriglobia bacterium]|nr:alpha/beta hydrolase-fold protein [Terriglobia bacterium]
MPNRPSSSHILLPRHARLIAAALVLGSTLLTGSAAHGASAPGATTLDCGEVQSTILGRSVSFCADLPADYATSTKRYPVLYFLHGLFENERSWAERGGKDILDGMLAKGELEPFIVVCPDAGKTFYVNSYDGKVRYEDFFVQEFIPYIEQHYRTVATRAGRGLFGVSMGGFGSLHIGFRHANLFGAVSAQSAALLPKLPNPFPATRRWQFYAQLLQEPFGSPLNEAYFEANNPIDLAEHSDTFKGLRLYFDCGDHDRYGFLEGNQDLDKILTAQHFPHEFAAREGDHGWSYEEDYMHFALQFHSQEFHQALASAKAPGSTAGGRSK